MKIIISGGGTGGHIYPAIAIIEELQKRVENLDLLYVGTKNSMEEKLIPKLDVKFKTIRVKGLPRKINTQSMIALKELYLGLKDSKKILQDFDPDVVIGTGGFVSGPLLYTAAKTNALTMIHEQNSYPGLTNRILSRFVDKYFLTYAESLEYFKYEDRAIITGNPIRNQFVKQNDINEDFKYFNLNSRKKTIFSFGGSNGSLSINNAIYELLHNKVRNDLQWIHVTGKRYYHDFTRSIEDLGKIPELKIFPYLDEMDRAYNIADVVITSSGAISLAEISYMGVASILIPKAYTTENHQEYNAKAFVNAGAAQMILEKDLDGDNLKKTIDQIIDDDHVLEKMKEASKSLAKPNAAKEIVDTILECRW